MHVYNVRSVKAVSINTKCVQINDDCRHVHASNRSTVCVGNEEYDIDVHLARQGSLLRLDNTLQPAICGTPIYP